MSKSMDQMVGLLWHPTKWHKGDSCPFIRPLYFKSQPESLMYLTLSELRDSINKMIVSQGKDAPCAAFVFTMNDVFYYYDDNVENEEQYLPMDDTEKVLNEIGSSDYIYEQVNEIIDDVVRRIRNMWQPSKWHKGDCTIPQSLQ